MLDQAMVVIFIEVKFGQEIVPQQRSLGTKIAAKDSIDQTGLLKHGFIVKHPSHAGLLGIPYE